MWKNKIITPVILKLSKKVLQIFLMCATIESAQGGQGEN